MGYGISGLAGDIYTPRCTQEDEVAKGERNNGGITGSNSDEFCRAQAYHAQIAHAHGGP